MTPLGWVIFIVSNAIVIGLCISCIIRIFLIPREHMQAFLEIDTHDLDDNEDPKGQKRGHKTVDSLLSMISRTLAYTSSNFSRVFRK